MQGRAARQRLIDTSEPNKFISILEIRLEIWQKLMVFHPKTLVCSVAVRVKEGLQLKFSDLLDCVTEEMYEMGELHHFIIKSGIGTRPIRFQTLTMLSLKNLSAKFCFLSRVSAMKSIQTIC